MQRGAGGVGGGGDERSNNTIVPNHPLPSLLRWTVEGVYRQTQLLGAGLQTAGQRRRKGEEEGGRKREGETSATITQSYQTNAFPSLLLVDGERGGGEGGEVGACRQT